MRIVADPAGFLSAVDAATAVRVHDGGLARRRFSARASWDTGDRMLADDHLVYAVDHGEVQVVWADGSRRLGPGDVAVIPPGIRFRARAGAPAPRLIRLRLAVADAGGPVAWGSGPVVVGASAELRRVLDLLADAVDPGAAHAPAWERAGARLLAVALVRASAGRQPGALGPELVARCRDAVGRDPLTTPRDLARACGLSHDWFTRAFVRAVHRPPRRWLVEVRVRLAAERLAAGSDPAWTVAQGLGWRDPKLFGRQFRSVMGAPPGRWRRGQA